MFSPQIIRWIFVKKKEANTKHRYHHFSPCRTEIFHVSSFKLILIELLYSLWLARRRNKSLSTFLSCYHKSWLAGYTVHTRPLLPWINIVLNLKQGTVWLFCHFSLLPAGWIVARRKQKFLWYLVNVTRRWVTLGWAPESFIWFTLRSHQAGAPATTAFFFFVAIFSSKCCSTEKW